jgi:hypothetical protein
VRSAVVMRRKEFTEDVAQTSEATATRSRRWRRSRCCLADPQRRHALENVRRECSCCRGLLWGLTIFRPSASRFVGSSAIGFAPPT